MIDWATIHHYAEEAELWSSLGINFWLLVSGVVYFARRIGLVEGIPVTIADVLVEGAYFSFLLVVVLGSIAFALTGDWFAIALASAMVALLAWVVINKGPLMAFPKKRSRRKRDVA